MTQRCRFNTRLFHFQATTLVNLVKLFSIYTHASANKQYKLVPVKGGRRCPAAGEVTISMASHWPYVTDLSLFTYTVTTQGLWKGEEHPFYTSVRVYIAHSTFYTMITAIVRDHPVHLMNCRLSARWLPTLRSSQLTWTAYKKIIFRTKENKQYYLSCP